MKITNPLSNLTSTGLMYVCVIQAILIIVLIFTSGILWYKVSKQKGALNEKQLNSILEEYRNWPDFRSHSDASDCPGGYLYKPDFYNGLFK